MNWNSKPILVWWVEEGNCGCINWYVPPLISIGDDGGFWNKLEDLHIGDLDLDM
jgi:hypothetical protein